MIREKSTSRSGGACDVFNFFRISTIASTDFALCRVLYRSNTNGGIPGPLTGNQIQKENYFSAATNVAYLADANFNGNIQYDMPVDGVPTTIGVEPFAYGERNPFGICLHSNGYLYGTDNGPNFGYVSRIVSACCRLTTLFRHVSH